MMTESYTERQVKLCATHLMSRDDVIGVRFDGSTAIYPSWTADNGPDHLENVIRASITGQYIEVVIDTPDPTGSGYLKIKRKGKIRALSYTLDEDNLVNHVCWDFDGSGHADALADPRGAADAVCTKLKEMGLHPLIERSGGAMGYHVWLALETKVSAKEAKAFGESIVGALKPELLKLADSETDKLGSVEVFPKQATATRVGNGVFLPWWHGATEGGAQFIDGNGHALDLPTVQPCALPHAAPAPAPAERPTQHLSDWQQRLAEWRDDAVNGVDLHRVYGDALTGNEKGNGFLECRDFRSSTGDRNPSAGVYCERYGDHERGFFYSFRDGHGMDIFAYMVATGQAANFKDACIQIARMTSTEESCPFVNRQYAECEPQDTYFDGGEPTVMPPPRAALSVASEVMRYKPFDFDLVDGTLPEREMLLSLDIPGEPKVPFLPAGIQSMFTAPGGTYKTQLLTQLAVCVVLGEYWLRHIKVERPGKVLLILAEEDEIEAYRRILQILQGMFPWLFYADGSGHQEAREKQEILKENLRILALKGQRTPFVDDHGNPTPHFESLITQVAAEENWSLIVIDPLVQVGAGGTETDNHLATALVQIINRFTTLKPDNKTTVIVAHHVSQAASSGGAGQTAARGVTALTDGMRWVMNIERIRRRRQRGAVETPWDDPYMDGFYMLKHVKSNYTKRIENMVLHREKNGTLSLIPKSLQKEWNTFTSAWFESAEETTVPAPALAVPPQTASEPEFEQGSFDDV